MPYREEMNWDDSKRRWHRMHKGVMYRVTPSQLGCMVWTREGSRTAANQWWIRKQAELDGPPAPDPVDVMYAELVETKTASPMVKSFTEALLPLLPRAAKAKDRTIRANGEQFLAVVKGDMQPLSFREIKQYINSLNDTPGLVNGETDVNVFDEAQVECMYLALRNSDLSSGAKKKRWGFYRRFVKYLWEKRLIEMPRNLSSYAFEVKPQRIKTYGRAEVATVLSALKPRLRLYAMLGLNCGMTSVDMGQMTKGMIDLDKGRIVRRRVKTADHASVPTVDYKLWPETVDLLKQHRSDHPELFLTSEDGTPLWSSNYKGDKVPTKDLIYQQFKRAKVPLTLKTFRSVSATIIERHEQYGRYVAHFLGHSPKSIADKHYAAPSVELFDRIMDWLCGQLFTT